MDKTWLTIEAEVKAPLAEVWNKYNSPEHIVNWNFAVDDWHCPSASTDLKVGGKMVSRMEAKDGSFGFDFSATYTDIQTEKFLAYVLDDGRNVKVQFSSDGDLVKIVANFEPESQNPHEMQQGGWQMILNNFKKYCEQ